MAENVVVLVVRGCGSGDRNRFFGSMFCRRRSELRDTEIEGDAMRWPGLKSREKVESLKCESPVTRSSG